MLCDVQYFWGTVNGDIGVSPPEAWTELPTTLLQVMFPALFYSKTTPLQHSLEPKLWFTLRTDQSFAFYFCDRTPYSFLKRNM